MSNFSVEIGEKEKHVVSFDVDRLTGATAIKVDGNPVQKGRIWTMGSKEYNIEVGAEEKHSVRFVVKIPWRQWRQWPCDAFVDGKLQGTYPL
jgi:hypothetical protein